MPSSQTHQHTMSCSCDVEQTDMDKVHHVSRCFFGTFTTRVLAIEQTVASTSLAVDANSSAITATTKSVKELKGHQILLEQQVATLEATAADFGQEISDAALQTSQSSSSLHSRIDSLTSSFLKTEAYSLNK